MLVSYKLVPDITWNTIVVHDLDMRFEPSWLYVVRECCRSMMPRKLFGLPTRDDVIEISITVDSKTYKRSYSAILSNDPSFIIREVK